MGSYWVVTIKRGKKTYSYKLPGTQFKTAQQVRASGRATMRERGKGEKFVSIKKVTPKKPKRKTGFFSF